jgi:hypothetical protein
MNRAMFGSGVYFAQLYNDSYLKPLLDPGVEVKNNVTGKLQSPINVYASDFRYFAGAAAVQLFSILVILFTFYGYWRLGRAATLSPLEIAKVRPRNPQSYLGRLIMLL